MLSAGPYAAGLLELVLVVAALGAAAYRVRARVLPAWEGAPARLVELVFAIAALVWLAEVLGTAGILEEAPLVLASLALAGVVLARVRPRAAEGAEAPPAPGLPPLAWALSAAVVAGIVFHWGLETKESLNDGIGNFDSLWYHMPFATEIAQSGSTTGLHRTETVFLNWFYPQNSELVHGVGLALTDRDTLSLFLNMGWLGVTLLAAWCVGRPFGLGPLTLIAAGIVLESEALVVREPGAAKNDLAAAALVLASVAILLNAWEARRAARPGGRLKPGWALGAAGLAAGLAAGTKVTAIPPVAALTVLAILLAPRAARGAAAAWWILAAVAGGGYWYARNLVVAGNPVPQVTELGPLTLPGPERLQEGRPDYTVLHYATDTEVWSEYFGPGLADAFGTLWPLVILAAVGGAVLAIARGGSPLVRGLGGVALFSMAAYLATPLSAAGAEGAPEAFGINVRFAVPALLLGLCLLPLGAGLRMGRAWWAAAAALLGLLVLTNESWNVLRGSERLFGLGSAVLLVLVPAGLLLLRRRRPGGRPIALAGAAALALLLALLGYEIQRDYLRDRYERFEPSSAMSEPYAWAAELENRRIGLAGTTAGFHQYGLYGKRLSNDVIYLGREADAGGFDAIPACAEFRSAVNDAGLGFLVTSPFLNFINPAQPIRSPEAGWLRGEEAVRPILRDGPVTVWRVGGRLDPRACGPRNAPLRLVPDQPGA